MLSEWYFCCCLRMAPEDTLNYLSILETLTNSENDERLLCLAYENLNRSDIWMQLYGLPFVLRSMKHEQFSKAALLALESYCHQLLESFPDEQKDSCKDLIDSVLNQDAHTEIIANLKACGEKLAAFTADRPNSQTPYLDLSEYPVENLLLSVMLVYLEEKDDFTGRLISALDEKEGDNPLHEFLSLCLDGRCGRLPLCLANKIAALHHDLVGQDPYRMVEALWKQTTTAAEFEPDLVQTTVDLLYAEKDSDVPPDSADFIQKLIEESILFRKFRELLKSRRGKRPASHPLQRIGYESNTRLKNTIPLIFWQLSLWRFAVQTDAAVAAEILDTIWKMPGGFIPNRLDCHCPMEKTGRRNGPSYRKTRAVQTDSKIWQTQLTDLLNMRRYLPKRPRIILNTSNRYGIPEELKWFFGSPWISMNFLVKGLNYIPADRNVRIGRPGGGKEDSRRSTEGEVYYNAEDDMLFLRLVTAASMSAEILRQLPVDSPFSAPHAKIVVHASHVIDSYYGRWLNGDYRKGPNDKTGNYLNGYLTGITLFCRRQIEQVGKGIFQSVAPDLFLGLMDTPVEGNSSKHKLFVESVIPEVLVKWILAAFPGAAKDRNQTLWLDHIPEVHNYLIQRKHKRHIRTISSLLYRFLTNDHRNLDLKSFDWRYKRENWKIWHRQLLLTQKLPPNEWIQPAWDDSEMTPQARLVRATERLSSLDGADKSVIDELCQAWLKDWDNAINSVGEEQDIKIDRFVRLRLLEMVNHPLLVKSPKDREVLVLFLLEFGRVYDLERLFDSLFFHWDEDCSVSLIEGDVELKKIVLKAAFRLRAIEHQRLGESVKPIDPVGDLYRYEKIDFLDMVFSRIALLLKNDTNKDLFSFMNRQNNSFMTGNRDPSSRKLKTRVGFRDKTKYLFGHEIGSNDWLLKGAVFNHNDLEMTLVTDDMDIGDTTVLFRMTHREIIEHIERKGKGKNISVLGMIVNIEHLPPSDQHKQGLYKYTANIGIQKYVFFTLNQYRKKELALGPGDPVKIPIQFKGDPQKMNCWVDYKGATPVGWKTRPGDCAKLHVTEEFDPDTRNDTLAVRWKQKEITELLDPSLWDVDISRRFRKLKYPFKYNIKARLGENDKWLPIDRDLTTLILNAFRYLDRQAAVLTYIGSCSIGNHKSAAYRFSTAPGENYVLKETDFDTDDVFWLEQVLKKGDAPRGLLLAVEPTLRDGVAKLKLFRELPENEIQDKKLLQWHYRDFNFPIDDRNIKWIRLFDDISSFKAHRERQNWYVRLEDKFVPGFPSKVHLVWRRGGAPVNRAWTKVDCAKTNWDPLTNTMEGEFIHFHRVRPRNNSWDDFLDAWLDPKMGQLVRIEKAIGSVKFKTTGTVSCLTDEKLIVRIVAESITMTGLPAQSPPDTEGFEGRSGEISERVFWFRVRIPLEIDQASLPDAFNAASTIRGIVVQVPNQNSSGNNIAVVWKGPGGAVFREHPVGNLEKHRQNMATGCRITGKKERDSWYFTLESPTVTVQLLWKIVENAASPGTLTGYCYHNNIRYEAEESAPGEIVLHENRPRSFQSEIPPVSYMKNRASGRSGEFSIHTVDIKAWRRTEVRFRRASMEIGDSIYSGNYPTNDPKSDIKLSGINMTLQKSCSDPELYLLKRLFRFRPRSVISTGTSAKTDAKKGVDAKQLIEKWQNALQEHLHASPMSPHFLETVTVTDRQIIMDNLKVPIDGKWDKATDRVKVIEGEGPFIPNGLYRKKSHSLEDKPVIRLVEGPTGDFMASFKRVPPMNPGQFRRSLNAPYYESVILERPLYFVGLETADPITDELYEQNHYRFELGYGKTLLVPEDRLRYNQEPFSSSEIILFHGDYLTQITFLDHNHLSGSGSDSMDCDISDMEDLEEEEPSLSEDCILALESARLQYSSARTLYNQRRDHKIIHLLHIAHRKGELSINSIEGFSERITPAGTKESREFRIPRARLAPADAERLHERIMQDSEFEDDQEQQMVIMGRLDEDRFRDSIGCDLSFDHVKLTSREKEDSGHYIQPDELIFLKGGEIEERRNDMAVQVYPPNGLDPKDVGADFKDMVILRRRFSYRENILRRMYRNPEFRNRFTDLYLLVRVYQKYGRNQLSILRKMPQRSSQALLGAISSSEELPFAIVTSDNAGRILVEWRPGTLVSIERVEVEQAPENMAKGAIVRLDISDNGKFRIIRAAFGQRRYVASKPRPALALPMNALINKKNIRTLDVTSADFFRSFNLFTIGGLPEIIAGLGRYNADKQIWESCPKEDFLSLMQSPHPKTICLGKNYGPEKLYVGIYDPEAPKSDVPVWLAGRIEFEESPPTLRFLPCRHGGKSDNKASVSIPWRLISFRDDSIQKIINDLKKAKWSYHDNSTGYWVQQNETEWNLEEQKINFHNSNTGPLFFQKLGKSLQLRFSRDSLLQFGFPVDELLDDLVHRPGRTGEYCVASVSDDNGLWIEISPGRIAEVPAQFFVWRPFRGKEHSLANLNWQGFAPGDRVKLKVASENPLTIDRLAMKEWTPGPRLEFGPGNCFLPVDEWNEGSGSLTLGAGEFKIVLPHDEFPEMLKVMKLTARNHLVPVGNGLLRQNDVVLLGVDNASNRLSVLGFPNLTPLPDFHGDYAWPKDRLAAELFREKAGKRYLPHYELRNLIIEAGGAVPVTVENIFKNVLYFSRRHQNRNSILPDGTVSIGRVIGYRKKDAAMLIRCGGLMTANPAKIVSGLPSRHYESAADTLGRFGEGIWLSASKRHGIRSGLREERNPEFMVSAIDVSTLDENKEEEAGIICRALESQRFYWLPARLASLTDLTFEELKAIFLEPGEDGRRRIFRVCLRKGSGYTEYVSAVDTSAVVKEYASIHIGREFSVYALRLDSSSDHPPYRGIVESSKSKIIFKCNVYDCGQFETGGLNRVEVVRKDEGEKKRLDTVPVGQKRYRLDLTNEPMKWCKSEENPTFLFNFEKIQNSRDEIHTQALEQELDLDQLEDDSLDLLLCYAYSTLSEEKDFRLLQFQISAAQLWIQRNRNQSELELAYALMAIIILHENSYQAVSCLKKTNKKQNHPLKIDEKTIINWCRDWRESAKSFTRQIGRRALCSMHLEVLCKYWLNHNFNKVRSDGLWARLQMLKPLYSDYSGFSLELSDIQKIKRFCEAVDLRQTADDKKNRVENHTLGIVPIAQALAASIGDCSRIDKLRNEAKVMGILIDIFRTLPVSESQNTVVLHSSHIKQLKELLEQMRMYNRSMILLDPLPLAL